MIEQSETHDLHLLTNALPNHARLSSICIVLNCNDDEDPVVAAEDRIIFTTFFKDQACVYSGAPVWTNSDRSLTMYRSRTSELWMIGEMLGCGKTYLTSIGKGHDLPPLEGWTHKGDGVPEIMCVDATVWSGIVFEHSNKAGLSAKRALVPTAKAMPSAAPPKSGDKRIADEANVENPFFKAPRAEGNPTGIWNDDQKGGSNDSWNDDQKGGSNDGSKGDQKGDSKDGSKGDPKGGSKGGSKGDPKGGWKGSKSDKAGDAAPWGLDRGTYKAPNKLAKRSFLRWSIFHSHVCSNRILFTIHPPAIKTME